MGHACASRSLLFSLPGWPQLTPLDALAGRQAWPLRRRVQGQRHVLGQPRHQGAQGVVRPVPPPPPPRLDLPPQPLTPPRPRARRNPKQVEWARSFVALLEDLRKYIMQHHTTGLSWNPKVRLFLLLSLALASLAEPRLTLGARVGRRPDDLQAVLLVLFGTRLGRRPSSPSPSPSSRRARPTSSSSRRQRTRIRSSSLERRRHVVRLCGAQPGRERHQGPQKGRRARDDAQEPRAARVGRRSCCWCVPSFSSFERERASEVGEDARAEER